MFFFKTFFLIVIDNSGICGNGLDIVITDNKIQDTHL